MFYISQLPLFGRCIKILYNDLINCRAVQVIEKKQKKPRGAGLFRDVSELHGRCFVVTVGAVNLVVSFEHFIRMRDFGDIVVAIGA